MERTSQPTHSSSGVGGCRCDIYAKIPDEQRQGHESRATPRLDGALSILATGQGHLDRRYLAQEHQTCRLDRFLRSKWSLGQGWQGKRRYRRQASLQDLSRRGTYLRQNRIKW